MNELEALSQAAAEGLELVRDASIKSGYKGVSYQSHDRKVKVVAYFKGKQVNIAGAGVCATAEEGALAYARWLRDTPGAAAFRQGCHQKDDKTQAELAEDDERLRAGALRQARVEGLELMRSVTGLLGQASAESGFSGVYRQKSSLPYYCRGRSHKGFRTAEEAALAEARYWRDTPKARYKRADHPKASAPPTAVSVQSCGAKKPRLRGHRELHAEHDSGEGEEGEEQSAAQPKRVARVRYTEVGGGGEGVEEEEQPGGEQSGEGIYAVERIHAHRVAEGRRQYLVRWAGWGPSDDTWEAEENIFDPALISDYNARCGSEVDVKVVEEVEVEEVEVVVVEVVEVHEGGDDEDAGDAMVVVVAEEVVDA